MAHLKQTFSSLFNCFRETRSLLLGIVRWDSCLDTDEEHLNFARRDELNRTHIEEGEETDGPLNFELDVCHQDPEHKSPAPLPCAQVKLITSWEAGWNVTNAIQVTFSSPIHYNHHLKNLVITYPVLFYLTAPSFCNILKCFYEFITNICHFLHKTSTLKNISSKGKRDRYVSWSLKKYIS